MKKSHIVICLSSALFLSACAVPQQYGYQDRVSKNDNYYNASRVEYGVVSSVREIYSEESSSGGMILGAIIGGVLGHQIGGGHGRDLATVAGAVAGGAIGNNVDNNGTRRLSGFDMTIRLDNGQTLRTTQPADQVFTSGARVRVESNGNSAKVIKLNY